MEVPYNNHSYLFVILLDEIFCVWNIVHNNYKENKCNEVKKY